MKRIQLLQDDTGAWSDKTFGASRQPTTAIHHLMKEVGELLEDPYEYADCLILLIDAARMAGISVELLLGFVEEKLSINKKRKWGTPDENGVVEHVRNGE